VLEHFWTRRGYLFALLAPVGFIPLLAPRRIIAALPMIALNLLSSLPDSIRVIDCHYSALAAPGIVYAAICGARRLGGWTRPPLGTAALAVAAAVGTWLWGAAPGCGGYHADLYTLDARAASLQELVDRIPADARVSVPADVVAHVAERQDVGLFPQGVAEADYAIVDLASRPVRGLTAAEVQARMLAELQRARAGGMEVVTAHGPLVLLGRERR
jgi:hypothetical protein